ncbi:MAG: MltA domain-containing protein [Pseudomonadota bacterium]
MRIAVLGVATALAVTACATPRSPGPTVPPPPPASPPIVPPPPPPSAPTPAPSTATFAALPGWEEEDHRAALEAFRATCGVARDAAVAAVCRRARALGPFDAAAARAFLEASFRPEPLGEAGLLTAYFSPVYEARAEQDATFSAPVRSRPADLDAAAGPYADRTEIETRGLGDVIAWMRPEELFFLQIQGSGVLVYPDGSRRRAAFAAHNSRPFAGIARPMREQGLLKDADTSGEAIRAWLAAHRGPEAEAVMRLNPRYVFFRLEPDDGRDPAGAAGVSLPAGRAIAVDPGRHAMGELFWIDASAPALTGAFPVYRRLAVALDTGGAIKGEVRADLYTGRGEAAGVEAGRVRHTLRLYRLVPVAPGG